MVCKQMLLFHYLNTKYLEGFTWNPELPEFYSSPFFLPFMGIAVLEAQ